MISQIACARFDMFLVHASGFSDNAKQFLVFIMADGYFRVEHRAVSGISLPGGFRGAV